MPEHRQILNIDTDAFFASVEQQANPELRGKPIAVVGGSGRTVITTSTYEARAKGVKTGMAIWEGTGVYTKDELNKLQNKLDDENKLYDEITIYGGG